MQHYSVNFLGRTWSTSKKTEGGRQEAQGQTEVKHWSPLKKVLEDCIIVHNIRESQGDRYGTVILKAKINLSVALNTDNFQTKRTLEATGCRAGTGRVWSSGIGVVGKGWLQQMFEGYQWLCLNSASMWEVRGEWRATFIFVSWNVCDRVAWSWERKVAQGLWLRRWTKGTTRSYVRIP